MATARVPDRVRRAVEMLQIAPDERALEIGCGPGVAVSLVCDRLVNGRIIAIDRSATAVKRATARNVDNIASGKAAIRQVDLAGLAPEGQRFDKIFAINVNVFWVRPAEAEVQVLKEMMRGGGVLWLFYEAPSPEQADRIAATVTTSLERQGFSVETADAPSLTSIVARLAEDGR
jgi:protein-L-isoaspartate O-methyltransferase